MVFVAKNFKTINSVTTIKKIAAQFQNFVDIISSQYKLKILFIIPYFFTLNDILLIKI